MAAVRRTDYQKTLAHNDGNSNFLVTNDRAERLRRVWSQNRTDFRRPEQKTCPAFIECALLFLIVL